MTRVNDGKRLLWVVGYSLSVTQPEQKVILCDIGWMSVPVNIVSLQYLDNGFEVVRIRLLLTVHVVQRVSIGENLLEGVEVVLICEGQRLSVDLAQGKGSHLFVHGLGGLGYLKVAPPLFW